QEAAVAQGIEPEKADPFNIEDPNIEAKMRARTVRVGGADETVRRKLAQTLADGSAKGETADELRERVKRVFNVADSRASLIARQEVGSAVEEARQVGRQQAGVPMKSWLWSQKKEG